MPTNIIDRIIKNKIHCIFISPHLDDVVLSCGALLAKLTGKTDVWVINVFTKAHKGPYTLSARKFLKDSMKYSDAITLYKERLKEDRETLSKLKIKIINLGLTDALFRRKRKRNFLGKIIPEIDHVYPTYRWHIVKKTMQNDCVLDELKTALLKKIAKKRVIVFAPYSIGNHVDHQITRRACEDLFQNIIYYSEFPYNIQENNHGSDQHYEKYELEIDSEQKNKLILLYKTQVSGLFSGGKIPKHKEVYFKRNSKIIKTLIYKDLTLNFEKEWQALWEKSMYANFFNSTGWFRAFKETFKPNNIRIIAFYKESRLVAVVPLINEHIYGINFFKMPGSKYAHRGCFLSNFNDKELTKKLIFELEKIGNIHLGQLSMEEVEKLKQVSQNVSIVNSTSSLQLSLAKNEKGQFILSRKRQIIKRSRGVEKILKLKSYQNKIREDIMRIVFRIDSKSSKSRNNYNVFIDKNVRKFYINLAKYLETNLRINLLYRRKTPVAYEIGFINKNTYTDSERAYVEKEKWYAPGKFLMVKLIETLAEQNFTIFDLGPGVDNFKKSLTKYSERFYNCVVTKNHFIASYLTFVFAIRETIYGLAFSHPRLYAIYRKLLLQILNKSNNITIIE